MSINQEELTASLAEVFGGGPSSPEGLDYARRVLEQGLSHPGVPRDVVDETRTQQEEVLGALQQARERIMEQKSVSRSEKWFALAAGLGAPTRAGGFGETAANVAEQFQPLAKRQSEFDIGRDESLSKLDIAEAGVFAPVTSLEAELAQLEYKQQQQNMREALKTISRGQTTGRGSALREAKISDLMVGWNLDRKWASARVDGFVRIELIPETGKARLINEAMHPPGVMIVPISSLQGFFDVDPTEETYTPPEGGSVAPGEVDTRTEEEREADLGATMQFKEGRSMWDMAGVGSGPMPTVRAGLSVPSSVVGGPVAEETLIAQQGLKIRSMTLSKQLVENPRMPVRLVEMAMEAAAIEPGFFETGPIMQAKMISLDQYLYTKYLEQKEYANDPTIPETLQESGAINAEAIGMFLRDMGVPFEVRRRVLFEPIDGKDTGVDLPSLEDTPQGVPSSTWDRMTTPERQRWRELNNQLTGAQ